ncbi:MAG: MoxR family ATPase [Lachnospiraceae bacterium]|nr:MoxR family ATPase [Lachnospiraceae bacterium]
MYEDIKVIADRLRDNIGKVVVGKEKTIDLMITSLFTGGHVLIEDTPGTGKTILAKSLAASIGADFKRVQFTPDLLPSDITGLHMYNMKENGFTFIPGPAFTNILLADELNRATPRTQSALLECMAETQITVDGETMPLKHPFFVMATENPIETAGTFTLPEALLDRFLMRVPMKAPTVIDELNMLDRFIENNPLDELKPVVTAEDVLSAGAACKKIFVAKCVRQYIVDIVQTSRTHSRTLLGASPRSALYLLSASQAYAAIKGSDFVTPDHIKALAKPVLSHRILLTGGNNTMKNTEGFIEELMGSVQVPTEDWEPK